jgi:hypothetical protein
MTYTESVFIFFSLLALYAMHRRWPLWTIAIVCGLTTAARPVGIALLLPFALHVWNDLLRDRRDFRSVILTVLLCAAACWGLLAYMLYQQVTFGDALAFGKTQEHWTMREVNGINEKIAALVSLEPVWSVYLPDSPAFWRNETREAGVLFTLRAANPLYFLVAIASVLYGARRGWLTRAEVLLSLGLILIPYVTRSYEMCMSSQGRFMAVVFPMYIVMGELLSRIPSPWFALIVAPAATLMAIYAALFAAGFVII